MYSNVLSFYLCLYLFIEDTTNKVYNVIYILFINDLKLLFYSIFNIVEIIFQLDFTTFMLFFKLVNDNECFKSLQK